MSANLLKAMNGEVGQDSSISSSTMDLAVPIETGAQRYIVYILDGKATVDALVQDPRASGEPERIPTNVNDLLDELLEQSVRIVGKPVAMMNKEDKVKAIGYLNDAGAMLITKSGDKIAKYFGISKYTLYSYLDTSAGNQES